MLMFKTKYIKLGDISKNYECWLPVRPNEGDKPTI